MSIIGEAFIKVSPDAKDFASQTEGAVTGQMKSLAKKAAVAFGGAFAIDKGVDFFKGAVGEAEDARKATALTEAVIKSTGGTAGVTADQVGNLANTLSSLSGVDDEVIQSAENVLLTFTNVKNGVGEGNDIFNQASKAALNMSAALGTDLQGANLQLGKALNDPIKGINALARAGVSFTAQQKEQITTLVKSGDTLGAQKIILAELNKEFAGAAEAAANPLDKLKVAWGNLKETLGTAIQPALGPIADALTNLVSGLQPTFQALGTSLASVFTTVGPAIVDVLGPIAETVAGTLGTVFDAIKPGLEAFTASFGEAFKTLGPVITQTIGPIATAVGSTLEALSPVFGMIGNLAEQLLPVIGGALTQVLGLINSFVGPLFTTLGPIVRDIATTFGDAFKTILDALGPVLQALGPQLAQLAGSFGQSFGGLLQTLAPVIAQVAQVIADLLPTLVPVLNRALAGIAQIVQAIGPVLGQLGEAWGQALVAIVPAIEQLFNALAPLIPIIAQVVSQLITGLAPIFPVIANAIASLAPVIADVATSLGGALGEALKALLPALGQVVQAIAPVVTALVQSLAPVLPVIGKVVADLAGVLAGVLGDAIKALAPIIGDLVSALAPLVTDVLNALAPVLPVIVDALGSILKAVEPILGALSPLLEALASVLKPVLEALTPIIKTVADLLAGVLGTAIQAVVPIITDLADVLKGVLDFITGVLSGDWSKAWEGIKEVFSGVWNFMRDLVSGVWNAITGVIGGAIDKVVGFFSNLPSTIGNLWSAAWNGLKNIARDVIDGVVGFVVGLPGRIKDAAKGLWNGLTDGLKGILNSIIGLWNKLDFGLGPWTIPDWVPVVGGKTFGIKDIFPDIPLLANGRVVTGPTLAMIGEAGAEVVLPLTNRRRMIELLTQALGIPAFANGGIVGRRPANWPSVSGLSPERQLLALFARLSGAGDDIELVETPPGAANPYRSIEPDSSRAAAALETWLRSMGVTLSKWGGFDSFVGADGWRYVVAAKDVALPAPWPDWTVAPVGDQPGPPTQLFLDAQAKNANLEAVERLFQRLAGGTAPVSLSENESPVYRVLHLSTSEQVKRLADAIHRLGGVFERIKGWDTFMGADGLRYVVQPPTAKAWPQLAAGGVVMPRPGGVPVTVAEAGRAEAVVPLPPGFTLTDLTRAVAPSSPAGPTFQFGPGSIVTSKPEDVIDAAFVAADLAMYRAGY